VAAMEERAVSEQLVICPECKQPSNSVKCFRMGFVLFLGIGAGAQWKNEYGCPGCIRNKTALFALFNILSANLLWPVLIFPMVLAHLVRSVQAGHSQAVLDQLR
jgi:hypothetical protein